MTTLYDILHKYQFLLYTEHVPFALFYVLIEYVRDTKKCFTFVSFLSACNDMSTHTYMCLAYMKLFFVKTNTC